MRFKAAGGIALALLLAACGGRIVPPSSGGSHYVPARRPVAATPIAPLAAPAAGSAINALAAGVAAGPRVATLPLDDRQAARALAAFRTSCPSLMRRTDTTGLTQPGDWQDVCAAAASASDRDARDFFARWFDTVQIADGQAFATGYYEPEIEGSLDHRRGYDVPIYGRPSDLIDVDLGQFSDALKGKTIRGRVDGTRLTPYYDRTAIEQGAIAHSAPIVAWAKDPVALFFLQVQGSGQLRLPDGRSVRIGYDSQNGRDYTGIGALLRQRGLLGPGQASMQGIVQWLHDHPDQGRDLMRENKSFVFFHIIDTPPVGAMGYPVLGGASAAVDPKFVPLGAPVFLSMDRTDATGLWIAQDTGGAIKGANRVDTFWGAGDEAQAIAGGMSAHGTAFVLLPHNVVDRLIAGGASGGTTPYP
jgi:membrane-bound lytic murein transglycosylase A